MIRNRKQLKPILEKIGPNKLIYTESKKDQCVIRAFKNNKYAVEYYKIGGSWQETMKDPGCKVGFTMDIICWNFPLKECYEIKEEDRFLLCMDGLKL